MSSTVQRVVCPCDVPGVFGRLLVRKLLKFNDVRAPSIPLMNACVRASSFLHPITFLNSLFRIYIFLSIGRQCNDVASNSYCVLL